MNEFQTQHASYRLAQGGAAQAVTAAWDALALDGRAPMTKERVLVLAVPEEYRGDVRWLMRHAQRREGGQMLVPDVNRLKAAMHSVRMRTPLPRGFKEWRSFHISP